MGKALFITGTGTDIGKTYVTGLIVKKLRDAGLRAGYYKAALSGAEVGADGKLLPGDVLHVARVADLAPEDAHVSYTLFRRISRRRLRTARWISTWWSATTVWRRSGRTI